MAAVTARQAERENNRIAAAESMANALGDYQMQRDAAKADEEEEETSVLDDKQGRR
jgi:hypothetical protein